MYSAMEISKFIVSKCTTEDHPVSNLQLQKILYYIQKEYLKRDLLAFSDEIEAWQFGPVVPNVYYYFCGYGAMAIDKIFVDYNISSADRIIMEPIVESKRELNPWDMVAETHRPSGAWAQTYRDGLGNHNVIPVPLIKSAG